MEQTEAIVSVSFFIAVLPSSLKVRDAADWTSSTTFSSLVLAKLPADLVSPFSVVVLLLFNLLCTNYVLLCPDFQRFKFGFGAVHSIADISSKRSWYDAMTAGRDSG